MNEISNLMSENKFIPNAITLNLSLDNPEIEFEYKNGKVVTKTNNSGGIQGGITNGMPIIFRVAIKPTPSIGKPQNTVNLKTKENVILEIGGRHDPCIVARAVPVVEAVAALALLDMMENE